MVINRKFKEFTLSLEGLRGKNLFNPSFVGKNLFSGEKGVF